MNTKKLTIAAGILIAAVAIIIISENLQTGRKKEKSDSFFPDFSKEKCSAILIKEKDKSVNLKYKNGVWLVSSAENDASGGSGIVGLDKDKVIGPKQIEEYTADSSSIQVVLEKIQNMKRDVLVSTNPEKKDIFDVDTAKGMLVKVWDNNNKPLGAVYIGKGGSDRGSNYIRMEGSDKVFAVYGGIKYSFFTDLKRWRDKSLLKFNPQEVKKFTIMRKDSGTIVLEKTVDSLSAVTWNIVSPVKYKAKAKDVDNLVIGLSNMKTTDWEEDPFIEDSVTGFNDPDMILTAVLENGETNTLICGKKKKDKSYLFAKTNTGNYTYLIAQYNVNKFKKSVDDLKEVEIKVEDEKGKS